MSQLNEKLLPPRIVFQTWKDYNIPPKWKPLYQAWKNFCLQYNYEHVLFSDEDNRNFIKQHYPWFLEKYDSYPYHIQRVDVIRYFYGHKNGAIYCDLDCCPKPDRFEQFQNLIVFYSSLTESAALSETVNACFKERLTNSIMIIKQGSPFMAKIFPMLMNPEKTFNSPIKHILAQTFVFQILACSGSGTFNDLRALDDTLLVVIPREFLSSTKSKESLMIHAEGGTWHNNRQMNKDVLRLVIISVAILFVMLFMIWFINKCVQKFIFLRKNNK